MKILHNTPLPRITRSSIRRPAIPQLHNSLHKLPGFILRPLIKGVAKEELLLTLADETAVIFGDLEPFQDKMETVL